MSCDILYCFYYLRYKKNRPIIVFWCELNIVIFDFFDSFLIYRVILTVLGLKIKKYNNPKHLLYMNICIYYNMNNIM